MHRRLAPILLLILVVSGLGAPAARAATVETTDAILDSLQYGAFRYAWDESNPTNGLIRDRSQPGSPCSIAAQGFGFSAICIGVDHGWVSRAAAAARVLTALQTFWNTPQGLAVGGVSGYKGLFFHFLDMNTATRVWSSELSTIDTALLLAGILDAKQFFDGPAADEVQIRALADAIYQRVDWTFVQTCNPPCCTAIWMGWKPESGFSTFGAWFGYNEAMILYLLAIGSPTHPIVGCSWSTWTAGYDWETHYGYSYVRFAPLFGHQYTHCWVDFRSWNDTYMTAHGLTYFENSRRATYAQRAYCIANPGGFTGYGADLWGLTASDDPPPAPLYVAHGAPPAENDNGTITPTAAISSIPFAPEIVIPVIENLWNTYKGVLWGPYGFRDAFNLTSNPDWYGADVLGIDQGPIAIMIENYRTSRVWNRFMRNPEVVAGLQGAGFTAIVGVEEPRPGPLRGGLEVAPNPMLSHATIRFQLVQAGHVRLVVYDVSGREIARLVDGERDAGVHDIRLDGADLPSGVYRCRLDAGGTTLERIVVRLR
ncbi:glucoamylase family protein [Actinokineospora sp.]|uniref:glucoamylase family protein n=1 Tax=Actinokineospora sp. TaxID=1872133 RepID=UPI003D6A3294